MLANVGTVKLFGKSRGGYMTRLKKPVYRGDTQFVVEPWLDIQVGDQISLASQSFAETNNDDRKVVSYNSETGLLTVDEGLENYHWGALQSTEEKYGFDIRCEVILHTRNVRVLGSYGNIQGGHIITAYIVELGENNEIIDRVG